MLPPTPPQSTCDIAVRLTVPEESLSGASLTSTWHLESNGVVFGHRLWCTVVVGDTAAATASTTPDAPQSSALVSSTVVNADSTVVPLLTQPVDTPLFQSDGSSSALNDEQASDADLVVVNAEDVEDGAPVNEEHDGNEASAVQVHVPPPVSVSQGAMPEMQEAAAAGNPCSSCVTAPISSASNSTDTVPAAGASLLPSTAISGESDERNAVSLPIMEIAPLSQNSNVTLSSQSRDILAPLSPSPSSAESASAPLRNNASYPSQHSLPTNVYQQPPTIFPHSQLAFQESASSSHLFPHSQSRQLTDSYTSVSLVPSYTSPASSPPFTGGFSQNLWDARNGMPTAMQEHAPPTHFPAPATYPPMPSYVTREEHAPPTHFPAPATYPSMPAYVTSEEQHLLSMGFQDLPRIRRLLQAHRNDINAAINSLLDS